MCAHDSLYSLKQSRGVLELQAWCQDVRVSGRDTDESSWNAVLPTALYQRTDRFEQSWPHSASLFRRQLLTQRAFRTSRWTVKIILFCVLSHNVGV